MIFHFLRRCTLLVSLFVLCSFQTKAVVVADFSSNVVSGCKPLSVSFTDLSTGGPTTWSWNFGNGNTSTLQNPSAIYNTPGTYTVSLLASNASSSSTKTRVITVFNNPTAAFSTVPAPTCVGKTTTFTDNSVPGNGAITNWHWDFADGTAVTTLTGSATHAYGSTGTYPASLIVTDVNGCTSNVIVQVSVNAPPVVAFTATPLTSCTAPLTVTFTNTSTSPGSPTYSWTFGDGSTSTAANPTHTYATTGIYSVSLVVTEGCKDSLMKPNYIVVQNIAADFKADTTKICAGQAVTFTDLSIPLSSTRTWTFGDGGTSTVSGPVHTYTTPGVYTVSLQANDASGCTNTKVKNAYITVFANPRAGFTNTTSKACAVPFGVTFTDTTTGAVSWNWSFGDGGTSTSQNPVHTYNANGIYSVKLVVKNANGCADSITKTSLVDIGVTHAFFTATPRKGCVPLTVTFTDTTTTAVIPPSTYIWDFGNGTTASTAVPNSTCTYPLAGVYTIKLTVVTATGCRDSVTKIGYVRAGTKPVTIFGAVPKTVCYGQTVAFHDSTVNANGWSWNFGDGSLDTTQNPSHLYGNPGTYTVQLIAYYNGCGDTLTKNNYIIVNPAKPVFTYLLSCVNYYKVAFTNTSIGADSVTWNFGDGTFDNTNNNTPVHTYATRGPESVILTAFNKATGCSFSQTQTFTIAEPIARFAASPNPATGCIPLNVAFRDSSQDAVSWLWNPGNGTSPTTSTPTVTYNTIGTFPVTLMITDVNHCTDTVTVPNFVHALGVRQAAFTATPQSGCAPMLVTFRDTSISDSTLMQWSWNFGDGSPVLTGSSNPSHNYLLRGSYTVSLTVTDKDGCTATATKPNYIIPTKPYPALTVDTFSCKGNVLPFDASATTGTAPMTYSWTFGDGATSTTATSSTTHAYGADNTYTVSLKVSDANGCDSVITRKILILKPVAAFKDSVLSYGCGTEQVQFTDLSTGFASSWLWNFGNGASSTLANPIYTYTGPGIYQVKLIVHNLGGCIDSVTKDSLIVVPGPTGSFTFSPKTGCVPLTVHFTATAIHTSYFTWDFGDGTVLTKTPLSSVQHTYTQPIVVTPNVLMGDTLPNGNICELPATDLTGTVNANQVIILSVLPASPLTILENQTQQLTTVVSGSFTNNETYSWTPSDGLSCTTCAEPEVSSIGQSVTYVLTLTDIGLGGCQNTDSVRVVFAPCEANPVVANVFTPNGDGINDILDVNGLCNKSDYRLEIYDRWGVQLFVTDAHHEGWDGRTLTGEPVVPGVYYYVISLDKKLYKGFVQLSR